MTSEAKPGDELIGVWKAVSSQAEVEGESEPRRILGLKPQGYLIFTKERRMMALITSEHERKPPKSDADCARLLGSMMGYSGKFTIDAEKFITEPDVSATGSYIGEKQVRFYKLEGDKLTIRSGVQSGGLIAGRRAVTTTIFQRER